MVEIICDDGIIMMIDGLNNEGLFECRISRRERNVLKDYCVHVRLWGSVDNIV